MHIEKQNVSLQTRLQGKSVSAGVRHKRLQRKAGEAALMILLQKSNVLVPLQSINWHNQHKKNLKKQHTRNGV